MKPLLGFALWIGIALVGFVPSTPALPVARESPNGSSVAFVHVDVLPMDRERSLFDQTVVVTDGRIQSLGPADDAAIPSGALVVDGRGRTLMPALCDMHVHLGGDVWNAVLPFSQQQALEEDEASRELSAYLAHGVTTVMVLSAASEHLALRDRIEAGELLGPRLVLARMIDAPPAAYPPPLADWVKTPDEARAAVQRAANAGYDRIKVYAYADRAIYDAILDEAANLGLPVDGHIPFDVPLERALGSRQAAFAHIAELGRFIDAESPDAVRQMAEQVAASGVRVITTLCATRAILAWFDDPATAIAPTGIESLPKMTEAVWCAYAEAKYLSISPDRRAEIRTLFEETERPLARSLCDAGVGLVLGTDAYAPGIVPGRSVHAELVELVDAGLTPYEALRTATVEPFALLGETARHGTVAVGMETDLLLLDASPLGDMTATSHIIGVLVRGHWLPAERLLKD